MGLCFRIPDPSTLRFSNILKIIDFTVARKRNLKNKKDWLSSTETNKPVLVKLLKKRGRINKSLHTNIYNWKLFKKTNLYYGTILQRKWWQMILNAIGTVKVESDEKRFTKGDLIEWTHIKQWLVSLSGLVLKRPLGFVVGISLVKYRASQK